MKTQKYYERDKFTDEEKHIIGRKSDNRCCHCGKTVFINYEGTIDHFIPLDKGGSNSMYNLIMLCKTCNEEKDNKIMSMQYIPYLKDKYKKELSAYVNSYITVMDYMQRNRLLAFDEYTINCEALASDHNSHSKYHVGVFTLKLKLATWNDLNRIHEYFTKYLKKYLTNVHDYEQLKYYAKENIIFWMQFGCIYYIEKNNEIYNMIAITTKHVDEADMYKNIDYIPQIFIFPYYSNTASTCTSNYILDFITNTIREEGNFKYLPTCMSMLGTDKSLFKVLPLNKVFKNTNLPSFVSFNYVCGTISPTYALCSVNDKDIEIQDSFKKFNTVTSELIHYFEKYEDRKEISWMVHCLLSTTDIKNSYLKDIVPILNENNSVDI